MTQPRPLLPFIAALAAAALAFPVSASAQAWTVGRPDPQPEFSAPAAPVYAPPPVKGAKRQTVVVSPSGAADGAVSLHASGAQGDPDSTVVDELDIVVRGKGPALYTVSRNGAQVVVMASYSPIPHLLHWDEATLTANLDGARELLMPPEPKLGVFEGARLALQAGAVRLPGYTPLQDQLPPPLRAKFAAAVKLAGQNPAKYAKWRPAAAGLWLLGDYRRAAGFSDLKPGTTIARLAKTKHVRVQYVGKLSVNAVTGALLSMSQPQQLACLDAASDQVLYESGHARAAAQAWADGRLHDVKANTSDAVLDRCLLAQTSVRLVLDRAAAEAAGAIDDALSKPGKTVAVIDLRLLDRPNGVLDRLKAQGAQISVPGLATH